MGKENALLKGCKDDRHMLNMSLEVTHLKSDTREGPSAANLTKFGNIFKKLNFHITQSQVSVEDK